jgi:hypothetical protein
MNEVVKPRVADDTVGQHARLALEKALGDTSQAARLLADEVRKNKSLRVALLDPLIEYACHQAVNLECRNNRDKVWSPRNIMRGTEADGVRAVAARNLLIFPLPGGKALGVANRAEIEFAAEFYRKQSDDMSHKSRWLRLVAQSVPDGKKAEDVLSNDRLAELQKEAASDE